MSTRSATIDKILSDTIVRDLDQTNIIDDHMRLVATGNALRTLHFVDLYERLALLKPADFAPHPLVAQLEFTQRCNLSCCFCYNSSGPKNTDELDLHTLERVCHELIKQNIIELIISGGEPLICPKHLEVIFQSFDHTNIPIHFLTNGILLSHERLQMLKQYNVVTLQVSLDGGNPDVHDQQRGMSGAWAKTMKGLSHATEHGFHTIVSCTLTRDNAETIGDLVDYCYLVGAKEVAVSDLMTSGRGKDWISHGACTSSQLDRVVELMQKKYMQYKGHMHIRLPVNMLFYICNICIKGQETILIRGNGDVIPHCTLPDLVVGNVYNQSIEEIWNNTLKFITEDSRLLQIIEQYRIVSTERLKQLRCYRRNLS